ncbi:hypothetical protein D3C76_1430820 [compost metagenome]
MIVVKQLVVARTLQTCNDFPDYLFVIVFSIILIKQPRFLFHIADKLFHLHADEAPFRPQLIDKPLDLHLDAYHHLNALNYINDIRQGYKFFKFRCS